MGVSEPGLASVRGLLGSIASFHFLLSFVELQSRILDGVWGFEMYDAHLKSACCVLARLLRKRQPGRSSYLPQGKFLLIPFDDIENAKRLNTPVKASP